MYNYKIKSNMKKNYNIPATEVVAFVGDSMIMVGSPVTIPDPNTTTIDPGTGGNG